jgi:hypothetical protein
MIKFFFSPGPRPRFFSERHWDGDLQFFLAGIGMGIKRFFSPGPGTRVFFSPEAGPKKARPGHAEVESILIMSFHQLCISTYFSLFSSHDTRALVR